jgi:RNA recognition motif-containing protein
LTYSETMVRKICEVFGTINKLDMQNDTNGRFRGIINIEFSSEVEAKRAQSAMMGFKVEDSILDSRKICSFEGVQSVDGEIFKSLIEDKPTTCLCLKSIVKQEEIESRIDYKELEFDVEDEMMRYGKCLRVTVPRPPLFGDPFSSAGFGRVYVRFREVDDAKRAKEGIQKRRFNGRVVEVHFYPEDRFIKDIWG